MAMHLGGVIGFFTVLFFLLRMKSARNIKENNNLESNEFHQSKYKIYDMYFKCSAIAFISLVVCFA